jgi:hypothetical protein
MSNFLTMILVLGGTFAAGGMLLYFSLTQEKPRLRKTKRDAAIETTAMMVAAQDSNPGSSSQSG